jgi:hypothetical protein
MKHPSWAAVLGLVAFLPGWAQAEPVALRYQGYVAGFQAIAMEAAFDLRADTYRVQVDYRTTGAMGAVMSGAMRSTVDGRFGPAGPLPVRFYSEGHLRGQQRVTQIDYVGSAVEVKQLVPPNDGEREAVPEALQRGTVDTLSAMAALLRRVRDTGRCDGRATTFDGRRSAVLTATTGGEEVLEATSRSSFSGPALRCAFEGVQTGGFVLGTERAELQRPQVGTAWFGRDAAGRWVPVRIAFRTRWFGNATMYVVGAG